MSQPDSLRRSRKACCDVAWGRGHTGGITVKSEALIKESRNCLVLMALSVVDQLIKSIITNL